MLLIFLARSLHFIATIALNYMRALSFAPQTYISNYLQKLIRFKLDFFLSLSPQQLLLWYMIWALNLVRYGNCFKNLSEVSDMRRVGAGEGEQNILKLSHVFGHFILWRDDFQLSICVRTIIMINFSHLICPLHKNDFFISHMT